jgi:hypothetical protein
MSPSLNCPNPEIKKFQTHPCPQPLYSSGSPLAPWLPRQPPRLPPIGSFIPQQLRRRIEEKLAAVGPTSQARPAPWPIGCPGPIARGFFMRKPRDR